MKYNDLGICCKAIITEVLCCFNLFLEESAYQMLSAPKPDGKEIAGIPVIVKLYAAHRDNADVVKNLVAMVAELTEYSKSGKLT